MGKHIYEPEYKKSFITKRYPNLIIMFLIIFSVFFIVRHYGLHERISLSESILMSFGNSTFVAHSWYLIDTMVIYLAYWGFMNLLKNRYTAIALYMSVFLFAYAVFLLLTGHGCWWFVTMHNYVVGIIFAIYKNRIISFYDKYRWIVSIVLILLFTTSFSYYVIKTTGEADSIFMMIIMMSSSSLFVILYSVVVFLFQFKSKVLLFYGSISLPFFLIQDMFIKVLPIKHLFPNELLFACYSIIGTTLSAFILTKVVNILIKYLFKPLNR